MTEQEAVGLENILKQTLESDIVAELEQRLDVSPIEAMRMYYSTRVSEMVSTGAYGTQYLSAGYLADEVMREVAVIA
jgi:hypothetical protein